MRRSDAINDELPYTRGRRLTSLHGIAVTDRHTDAPATPGSMQGEDS
jgi:hypothetical protein